jgi:hypothetical protein
MKGSQRRKEGRMDAKEGCPGRREEGEADW